MKIKQYLEFSYASSGMRFGSEKAHPSFKFSIFCATLNSIKFSCDCPGLITLNSLHKEIANGFFQLI